MYEFFVVAQVEDLQQGVRVRGKKVVITPFIINDFLEIREPQEVERFDSRTNEFSFPYIKFLKSKKYIDPCTATSLV